MDFLGQKKKKKKKEQGCQIEFQKENLVPY